MGRKKDQVNDSRRASCVVVLGGVVAFFGFQYAMALVRLTQGSGAMANKFSALAKDTYLDFLIGQNLYVLLAYLILAILFTLLLWPLVSSFSAKWKISKPLPQSALALVGAFFVHGFFVLRLVETRPYFLDDAEFGYWYFVLLGLVPKAVSPVVFFFLFKLLPLCVLAYGLFWYWKHFRKIGRASILLILSISTLSLIWISSNSEKTSTASISAKSPNVILIGSDSLRGDKLGYTSYQTRRKDGLAAAGVSPRIDALAKRSLNFQNCFTPIASTLESGTSLMSSLYPHSHGFRHMYPNAQSVASTKSRITPIASVLKKHGYDSAVFGDWCAGYFELMPLGFDEISVSSFDNFKIYMSQAVVMAHFVIPLYFDHSLGYAVFPQLGSFAQFVTPEVVTSRVKKKMAEVADSGRPFFWHVFYSCNHLPYRSPEPYCSMFTEPRYSGKNKSGVDFDIDSFIGGTDLENKWQALPKHEIQQIRDLYDGCTRQFDDNVGEILDSLKKHGLSENTIIIITSDHGDNLYEEGVTLGHGLTFNGGMHANHVPLLIHIPGKAAAQFPQHVRSIDLAPTLVDLLDAEKPASWEGASFAGWIKGATKPTSRPFYGETGFPFVQFRVKDIERPKLPPMDQMTGIDPTFNYQFVLKNTYEDPLVAAKQRCLLSEKWKLICTPTAAGTRHFALYSRHGSPHESDVSNENPEIYQAMKSALERWIDQKIETPLEEIFRDGE
jgi:arylsulfatase A-like enzyme